MKIAVAGLWHLGCVTAGCLSQAGFDVTAWDPDKTVVSKLLEGIPPVSEPGLNEILFTGQIQFASDSSALADADTVWVTFDTPVDSHDVADVDFVTNQVRRIIPLLKQNALVLISSQLPVGTTRQLMDFARNQVPEKQLTFAVSPENLRLGKAIEVFTQPDRVVVGIQADEDKTRIEALFMPFTSNIIWMSILSAEMTKHALNSFLALSVAFINEVAVLCEAVGADAREVERGLKSESRIGNGARLRPGGAIAGGTLLRDVNYLRHVGKKSGNDTYLLNGLMASNDSHKQWLQRKLEKVIAGSRQNTVAIIGLSYKPGSDTLRRSSAVEMCCWLSDLGVSVAAWDPMIHSLPEDLQSRIQLHPDMLSALKNADAAVISSELLAQETVNADAVFHAMRTPVILDPGGWLMNVLAHDKRIQYQTVGGCA